jgi:hypothetical protein
MTTFRDRLARVLDEACADATSGDDLADAVLAMPEMEWLQEATYQNELEQVDGCPLALRDWIGKRDDA